jgi:hypothetical protein
MRHRSLRSDCFTAARKFNYDARFPHLLIDRAAAQ